MCGDECAVGPDWRPRDLKNCRRGPYRSSVPDFLLVSKQITKVSSRESSALHLMARELRLVGTFSPVIPFHD